MATWHWQTWEGLPYLTCSLLSAWPHGFFTRQFSPRSPDQLTPVLQPAAEFYRVTQVHGNQVLTTQEVLQNTQTTATELKHPEADAIITQAPNQAVWVCSADCVPILIADQQTGQAVAIHAGWRGTAAQIVPGAIARLQAQGSELANLYVALGPAISGELYQVSEEVAIQVVSTIDQGEDVDSILKLLAKEPQSPLLPDSEPGKIRLDVRRVNVLQLEQLGLRPEQIAVSPHCTYTDSEHFFSYRRDALKKVQWSGIISQ